MANLGQLVLCINREMLKYSLLNIREKEEESDAGTGTLLDCG